MEQPEANERATAQSVGESSVSAPATSAPIPSASVLAAQGCPTCGAAPVTNGATAPSYVYAVGTIEAQFGKESVEKEFAQAIGRAGRAETARLTDRQVLQKVLSQRENRYLARQLCWVMTIKGLETYILIPRDSSDLDLFIEAVRATPTPGDLDVVIGTRGPIAPPEMCNGLMVPMVLVDQMYSFHKRELLDAIPKPEKISAREFAAAAEEVFDRIMQMADNAGATDEHRAANYSALRDRELYYNAVDNFARNASLTAIQVLPSRLSGITRKVMDVIVSYTGRENNVTQKFYVSVDVTEEFPFKRTPLLPYVDR
jgi:cyclic patellamide precursor peptide PatG